MHKKQITTQTNRNNIKHWKSWNHRNEIKPLNFTRVKWCITRPFRKDEITIEIEEIGHAKIEKCIQWEAYINIWGREGK